MNDDSRVVQSYPSADQLATEFAVCLLDEVGEVALAEIVRRNESPTYAYPVCASQTFTDANMVMLRACNGFDVTVTSEDVLDGGPWDDLWSEAWLIARRDKFREVLHGVF
ncbi:hypothetical protein JY96_21175 [Aquabacterium sp. NJ1]|uniref:hypothetical protein n=1 Tax=Aquabacterium sp. NJ1 TaxID=1538295 RepID=UPI00052DF6EE|nr:hypothetical protein [Aquabacterium sp. NJ1]KGM38691.1 hypothetical protein JY96_21175 [Aquabacterium sp. NJ1]